MTFLKKLIAYPLSAIYYLFFGLILVLFHPIQWLSLNLGGYTAHRHVVNFMNLCLVRTLHILGTRISIRNSHNLPTDKPLIIVSNHQSLNDIPTLSWYMRRHHPKFVAKQELEKGIPSVSFNLRHGGSALIDRKNPKQALTVLKKLGQLIEKKTFSAVIFPEGTRSRDGKPKRFSENGLKMLTKFAPNSVVVPVTINNSWEFLKFGGFPMELGVHLTFDVHEPIETKSLKFPELFEKVEETVKNAVILPD
ncbi:MAG: 1-acyl-sn-glycerol-3-phosphate acyltransferase [Bacteroidetes bacterium MedPE-SWsnd-G1]|nr:MAG: 1-acyl-sn-glycerol-3-phosphate acyltransferase [Bacteroidetes bacterium MedPE-SWsnd-G1]